MLLRIAAAADVEGIRMTATLARISPFTMSDSFGEGRSDEAEEIRQAQKRAFLEVQSRRALPPYLTLLSPEALIQVDARWSDACEAMFEFLAAYYAQDLLKLVSANVLAPSTMTFAAEIAGTIANGQAVRAALTPLLDHESPLVREGAIYGLRDHADETVEKKLASMAQDDPSPAIRRAAGDTLDDL
jgi:HEAT repeat protein